MLVFIDESGDPGFKLSAGSSPLFVVAMIIFQNQEDAAHATSRVKELASQLKLKPEIKFNKCNARTRDLFFEGIASCQFKTRAIIVDKSVIYSDHLRTNKDDFYRFFVRQMMEHDQSSLHDAKIVVDGSGDRNFKRQLTAYLRKNLQPTAISKLDLKDSRSDKLLQLADMVAGSIARHHHRHRHRTPEPRWLNKLRNNGQVDDLWEFK